MASPTRAAALSTAALTRSVPTAPVQSAGRPARGGSSATTTALSLRSSKLSSRLKKLYESGIAYSSRAGGIATRPALRGKMGR